jgi:hypothetical protein
MAATFTGPLNWGPDPNATLTATKLATWISGITVSNIIPGEFVSGSQPFFVGPNEPLSAPVGLRWRDTSFQMTRVYDGSFFQPESQGRVLYNTGATLPIGTAVAFGSTYSSISRCDTNRFGGVLGVSATLIGQNMFGLIRTAGMGPCLVTGTCTAGDVLSVKGQGATPVGGALQSVVESGGFTSGSNRPGVEVAFALLNNNAVAGLVTCLVIR